MIDYLLDTRHKLNVHKTFRRRPGHLLNVLCTFNLCLVSRGQLLSWQSCLKIVCIRGYFDPYFPTFGLDVERHGAKRSECGKIRTRITPNTDSFYLVYSASILHQQCDMDKSRTDSKFQKNRFRTTFRQQVKNKLSFPCIPIFQNL